MDKIEIDYYMGTATFFVDIESSDKKTFRGQFKVKCILSPLEFVRCDSMYRELLGKVNPQLATEYVSQLSYAMSQLKHRIMECPTWFRDESTGVKGNVDDKVLLHVFDKSVEAEAQYREGIEERYEKANKSVREAIDKGELKSGKEQPLKDEEEEENIDR